MKKTNQIKYLLVLILLGIAFLGTSAFQNVEGNLEKKGQTDPMLSDEIARQDSIFFNAYNHCDLETQARMIADNVEFYHDQGGLSTSKQEILEKTKENICGKVTRELVAGSIEVYPIKDYGAVEIGMHKFHNNQEPEGTPSHPSKFIVIWRKENNSWQMARVISLH
jgi:ketosteroid isomerase-like protein